LNTIVSVVIFWKKVDIMDGTVPVTPRLNIYIYLHNYNGSLESTFALSGNSLFIVSNGSYNTSFINKN